MLNETILMNELANRKSRYHDIVLSVYEEVESLLNSRIAQVFPTYTQHDIGHSVRIIGHIEKVIPDVKKLNDLELSLLLLSALLHDIGMAASDEEIKNIREGHTVYNNINYSALLNQFNGNEIEATQEYIRKVHAERSAVFIEENLKEKLVIPGMPTKSFAHILALICKAHTQDIIWVKNNIDKEYIIGDYNIFPQFYAIVLRLGDILDFDSLRTPHRLYNAISPSGFSKEEWQQHFIVDNTNKIYVDSKGKKSIQFYGQCSNPKIHRKVLSYIDWINDELLNAIEMTKDFNENHKIDLYPKVLDKIISKDYSIIDLKFQMNYKNTIDLLLGESLYGDKKIGLRELIQNSIDASLFLKEIKSKDIDTAYEDYHPKIYIIIDKNKNLVKVKDNGKGMNIYALKKYFLEVGSSYFKSQEFLLSGFEYRPIGNYGIGFLASFMLSDTIKVKTRDYRDNKLLEIDIFKDNEYVSIKEQENTTFNGTEITLDFNQFFDVFEDIKEIVDYIQENFMIKDYEIILDEINSERIHVKPIVKDTNNLEINLSKYLNGIEATLELSRSFESPFIKYLDDIKTAYIDYCFDGEQLQEVLEDKISIKDYLEDNKLQLISFMVVQDSYDLEKIIEAEDYIDDIESIYREKYHDEDINLVILPGIKFEKFGTGLIVTNEIVEGLTFNKLDKFKEFHHDNSEGTYYYDYKLNFFGVPEIDIYLQLVSFRKHNMFTDFYVRNVLVENSIITFNNAIMFQNYKNANLKFNLNILNKKIIPNVSRNEILKSDKQIISNSVQQALYLNLLEATQNPIEKLILKEYIKKYHKYDISMLKEEYIQIINNF
uniref:HD domain-containing protein n=1 Tax=Niallia taxi TaxID=2499688 RepID=UPI003F4925A3